MMDREVMEYGTGRQLTGRPTRALIAASDAADPSGAVYARRRGAWWRPVRADEAREGDVVVYVS